MAQIKPFHGIRYNPDHVSSMADVVSPPYDVISENEQADLHDRSPHNVIRLELGRRQTTDDDNDNPHTRADRYLREWLQDGTLLREDVPAVYLTATEFEWAGKSYTRWGLLASVRLEPFHQGGIRPHEHTYSKIKSERLALMRACRTNVSPIFSFFSDTRGTMSRLVSHAAGEAPVISFQDMHRHQQKMWIIRDAGLHDRIARDFEEQTLYIADGHHRYETALAYRDKLVARGGYLPEDHPAHFTMMYLSSIQDPGLMILPAHRLLPKVAPETRQMFFDKARPFFKAKPLTKIDLAQGDAAENLLAQLDRTPSGEALIVIPGARDTPVLLQLLPDLKASLYPPETPAIMKDLDVTLLTEFVFPKLLGLAGNLLDDVGRVHYHHDAHTTVQGVLKERYEMAFIIKPPPITAVQQIAAAGHVMPRKSTYFAPKVITGLVMHALE